MGKINHSIENYIRVGTEYYRHTQKPLENDFVNELVKWKKDTIRDDFGTRDYNPLYDIKKYIGFCFKPGHGDDYKQEINGFYNQYEKLKCEPKKGNCTQTLDFMKHIFGDQFEFGLDYVAILYLHPSQILPILCLVSEERATGKSTFVKLLKRIFEGNMTINSNDEFRARFNSDWINKLIIAVEETLLEKKEDSERIKSLSTGDTAKIERKNIDKSETSFYGKFILCSNNETNFIKIDPSEIRYWVRKIDLPAKDNTNLLDEMVKEIPAFLYYLKKRGIKSHKRSRMWFHPEDIYTPELEKLKSRNKSGAEREIETIVMEKMNDFGLDEIKMTLKDLYEELKLLRISQSYIKEILQDKMKLKPVENASTYKRYFLSDSPNGGGELMLNSETRKGRYYTFNRSMFESDKLNNSKKSGKIKMEVIK